MTSSALVTLACIITMILVKQDYQEENFTFLIPLILLGFAYSIYAGALWSSVPYVVKPHTLGTAFGLCTSVQNIGLTIIPLSVTASLTTTTIENDDGTETVLVDGFVYEQLILAGLAFIGVLFGIWLWLDDIHNRNGQLTKVPEKEEKLTDMMTSPTTGKDRVPGGVDDGEAQFVEEINITESGTENEVPTAEVIVDGEIGQQYKDDPNLRNALKRSLGGASMKK